MSHQQKPRRRSSRLALGLLGVSLFISPAILQGCQPETKQTGTSESAAPVNAAANTQSNASQMAAVDPEAYKKANELGFIPVMEYHRFGTKEERWTRTYDNFRKDLEFYYNNGYYLVNMRDMANKKLDVPAGKKPLVLTFDDATLEQFKYAVGPDGKVKKGADGKPVIDPDCAVGILDAFYAKHPDFGRAGTFYVLPSGFEQDAEIADKFHYLIDTGREIGNHTWGHDNLSKLPPAEITKSLSKLQAFVNKTVGHPYEIETLALPNGLYPKSDAALAAAVEGGSGDGHYHNKALLLVGSNPNVSPYDKSYKATAVARIQAIDEEFKLWFNRKPGSTAKTTESRPPYISDGDPTRVTFPISSQKYFNPAALPTGVKANPIDPKAKAKTAEATPSASASVAASPVASPVQGAASPAAVAAGASPAAEKKNSTANVSDQLPGYSTKLPAGGKWDGTKLTYTIKAGDSVEDVAYKFVKFTDFYTYPALTKGIRAENHLNKPLSIGQVLVIPKPRTAPPAPKMVPVGKNFVAKGIYITGTTAGDSSVWDLVKELKAHGGNTVVFDAKDMNGVLTYASEVPLAKQIKAYRGGMIQDLPKFLERMHQEGIHTVARLALFHDARLAQSRPDLTLRSKRTGKPWLEVGQLSWVDPSLPAVQDYNLALAKELIANGVDEIQWDYVRFPAMGDTPDIKYSTMATQKTHHDVITAWVNRAYNELHPSGALISADVYGVVAWDEGIDVKITGQDLTEMGHYLDAISPMLYPSHFYGNYQNYAYPPDHPAYFVGEGVKRVAKKTAGTGCMVRPWLQAFPFRIHHYGPDYVAVQLRANEDAAGQGWLLWNAENTYKVGFAGVDQWTKKPKGAVSDK